MTENTNFANIDVIIPCLNAAETLSRAVQSALAQAQLGRIWLINDGSTDETGELLNQWAAQFPDKIAAIHLPQNQGVAAARNLGALLSNAEFVAFLDADDAYENGALSAAAAVFHFQPETLLVRLALKPVNLAARYAAHPNFNAAWHTMQMTCGGNVVFHRAFFLACGGFPTDELFRQFGGEDGALGIATTKITKVATLFDDAGVLHFCRNGMHAERLLDAMLFNKQDSRITPEKLAQANAVTARIIAQISALRGGLNSRRFGIQPLKIEY